MRIITHDCGAMTSQLRHISTVGKKLLNSNICPTGPYNMVMFGPLAVEIGSLVWGTPANFNGFHVLAALITARHSSSGCQPNFAALNRGRHLYSAGRPSLWALAHILVFKRGARHKPLDMPLKTTIKLLKYVHYADKTVTINEFSVCASAILSTPTTQLPSQQG